LRYSLDSDAIIQAWIDYPIEFFPKVWESIHLLAISEVVGIAPVIYEELERGGDELFDWVKARKGDFVAENSDELQEAVAYLVNHYNNFGLTTGKNEGDPYVVALAMVEECIVVTNESMTNDMNGPKVPDVCREEGIAWAKFVDIIRNEELDVG
jgi:hypothetical protein